MHAIALRVQLRIEPQKRRYTPAEARQLNDLFGDTSRWAETLKPLQFANIAAMVPSFTGGIEVDLPVACTYDLEIAATSYFHALQQDDIPFLLLFSGTIFTRGETGFSVAQVPWHKEATYRVPVTEWRRDDGRVLPEQRLVAAAPRHVGGIGCVQDRPSAADLGTCRDDSARRSGWLRAGRIVTGQLGHDEVPMGDPFAAIR